MVRKSLRIVVEYSNTSNDIPKWEGTIFLHRDGIFEGLLNGVLDYVGEQYIVGKFIEGEGVIFLRLSDEENLNNSVVYTTQIKEPQNYTGQTYYKEIEPNLMSKFITCEPLSQTVLIISHTTNTDIQNRRIYKNMQKWKEETSENNLNILGSFYRELDTIETCNKLNTVEGSKVLGKQHPSSNNS